MSAPEDLSQLDVWDGVGARFTQADANAILDARVAARSVPVSARPVPFPPVSARVAADAKSPLSLNPRRRVRRVGGFVATAGLVVGLSLFAAVFLGALRMAGVL